MGRTVTILVDNNAVLAALVKGSSIVPAARRFITTFRRVASMFSISIWPERASSAGNCADAPSRGLNQPFSTRRGCSADSLAGFLPIQEIFCADSFSVFQATGDHIRASSSDPGVGSIDASTQNIDSVGDEAMA